VDRLLPFESPSRPTPDDGSRIVGIDDAAAGDVFAALSSDTTRDVFVAVYDTPGTATEIAEAVDTSLQNVNYHLTKLQEVDLIEVADTWYSEQGNEMNVYAPTNESVVVLAGDDRTRSSIRETLSRFIGTICVLGLLSILVESFVPAAPQYHSQSSQPSALPGWLPLVEAPVSPGVLVFMGGIGALVILVSLARVR
jgi:DNA-binding transcriptional ArsR family regulator